MDYGKNLKGKKVCYFNGFKYFNKNNKNKIKEQRFLKNFDFEMKNEIIWNCVVVEKLQF